MPDCGSFGRLRIGVDGRVLHDDYHGIGRVTEALIRELVKVPEVEVVLALNSRPTRRFDVGALLTLANLETLRFDLPLTSPRQILRWPAALRRARVDVMVFPYHLGAPLTGCGPRLVMVHDCILERPQFAPSARVRWAYRLLSTAVVRTNGVITPSWASAQDVHRYYRIPAGNIKIVPNGVEDKFSAQSADGERARVSLDLPEHYLLQVGVRRPHKNLGVLIRLLARLPDRHLVLVGNVDRRFPDPVPALATQLGVADRVHHFPFVAENDLIGIYQQADALLFPSLIEGFGLPLLEAMAAGTPVIASDIPAFAELAQDAAILVPPSSSAAWAEAVERLLGDPDLRTALVSRGRAVVGAYTWRCSALALLDAACQAIARAPAGDRGLHQASVK
jgi:glycosyltransferase involved in cell wall biosynthesis